MQRTHKKFNSKIRGPWLHFNSASYTKTVQQSMIPTCAVSQVLKQALTEREGADFEARGYRDTRQEGVTQGATSRGVSSTRWDTAAQAIYRYIQVHRSYTYIYRYTAIYRYIQIHRSYIQVHRSHTARTYIPATVCTAPLVCDHLDMYSTYTGQGWVFVFFIGS